MLEILHRSQAGTDYTIAYIDGRPAAISEGADGGSYGFVEDGEYIYNQYARQWLVRQRWQVASSTSPARSFAQQDILVNVAVSYTRREINDGSQEVYDGDLEVAFADRLNTL